MTLSGTANHVQFSTTAALMVYAFTFQVLSEDDIVVTLDDVVLTLTTDYSVSITTSTRQGSITLVADPGDSAKLIIARVIGKTQGTDYVEGDAFSAASHEQALDRLTMIAQDIDGARPFVKFTAQDATPSVASKYNRFKTANTSATTITMFDGGVVGQHIIVLIGDAYTTIDFTGTNLKGNAGANWSPSSGDWLEGIFDGTYWFCAVHDCIA